MTTRVIVWTEDTRSGAEEARAFLVRHGIHAGIRVRYALYVDGDDYEEACRLIAEDNDQGGV